jgi:RND family efflux transporter MFP subunit
MSEARGTIGRTPSRRTRSWLGAVCVGAIAWTSACERHADDAKPPPPPEVVVGRPIERDVIEYLRYTGTVEASETVDLRARVSGFLEKVNFKPGQKVKTGDVLFEIDKRQYAATVAQAEANLRGQEAALVGATNDARLAQELADQNAGPKIDAIIKAARRDALAAEVERARAQLDEARLNLEFCTVTAPINGRIGKNEVDVGNLVGRGEPTLLAQIVRTAPVFVSVDVSESDVLKVRRERQREEAQRGQATEPGETAPGQWRPAELALQDQDDYPVRGRIDFVAPAMNTQTGTLQVRTRFENEDEALLPGYFARLRFPMATRKAILVPEAALLSDQQGRFALVVNDKDEVEVRRVKLGVLEPPLRVVEEGLSPTDRVITLGVLKARPGAKVTPKLQEIAPPTAPPGPAPTPSK